MYAGLRAQRGSNVQRVERSKVLQRKPLWLTLCLVFWVTLGCEGADNAGADDAGADSAREASVGLQLGVAVEGDDTLTHWATLELKEALASEPALRWAKRGVEVCVGCQGGAASLPALEGVTSVIGGCGQGAPSTYVAGQFPEAFPIQGVAGDHAVLFAVQQSAGLTTTPAVRVMRRLDGRVLGALPAPPEGWGVPLTAWVTTFERHGVLGSRGELLISDVRVPPSIALAAPQPARMYRYRYSYSLLSGLRAQLVESATLPVNTVAPGAGLPDGFFYLGSFTQLPSGELLATDTITGAIWTAPSIQGPWQLAVIDARFGPGPVSDIVGVKRAPGGGLEPYTVSLPSPPGSPVVVGPGIESITYAHVTDEACVVSNAQGGVFCISRGALLDPQTPPFLKGQALRAVIAPTPGLTDLTDGVTYDRFHPQSPWLYWHRAPSDTTSFDGSGFNTLRRVNLLTGQVEVVAKSNTCFDWTYEIAALPPLVASSPFTSILSSLGQGPNDPALNMNLMGALSYVAPSLLPITLATSW
jgi:hypothetical protein